MSNTNQYVNLDEFAVGGGLKDDFDGKIVKARFIKTNYDGHADKYSLAVELAIEPTDGTVMRPDLLSVGDLKIFVPSEDGKGCVPTEETLKAATAKGEAPKLNDNCNFKVFKDALDGLGFGKIGGDIAAGLEGCVFHFVRKIQKERSGVTKTAAQIAKEAKYGPPKILVPTQIISRPGQTVNNGTGQTSAPSADTSAVTAAATAKLVECILKAGGKLAKKAIPTLAFGLGLDQPTALAYAQLWYNDEYLKNVPGTKYDGDSISLG